MATDIRFNQIVTISDQALSQEVNGETVILDLRSEQYFGLDGVGTRIWQLLQEHGDLDRAYEQIKGEYDVDSGQLEQDIRALVAELHDTGLITLHEKPRS